VARLGSNSEWLAAVVDKFVALARSSHFQDRQCFLKICASFLSTTSTKEQSHDAAAAEEDAELAAAARAFFVSKLASVFFTLALDPVSNVRFVFAESAVKHQRMCREHPECPDSLREVLAATEFSSAEELAAVLAECVKERLQAQAKLAAEAKSKEGADAGAEVETGSDSEAKPESESAAEASQDVAAVDDVQPQVSDEATATESAASTASTATPPVETEAPEPLVQDEESKEDSTAAPDVPVASVEAASEQGKTLESCSSPSAASSDELHSPETNGEAASPAKAEESVKAAADPAS
jgi:hypothetical protein